MSCNRLIRPRMGNILTLIRRYFSNQAGNMTQIEVVVPKEPGLNNVKTRIQACMVLSGVGDAIGYNDGKWEFCPSGTRIQEELKSLGGLTRIKPNKHHMIVSDDTVMHMATADALLASYHGADEQYCQLAREYKKCMGDMRGRAPGLTCMACTRMLKPDSGMYVIPFNPRGGGCGAAMRAVPIGLLYHRPEELDNLVRVGIESGRMTHNHPTGFLGSMTVALFVSYAIQGKEVREWGEGLLHTLHRAKLYCEHQKRDWEMIKENWSYFEDAWSKYVNDIKSADFKNISADQFDKFVRSVSFMGTGGASGHDAPMIAYDAILRCYHEPVESRWERLCRYGMFHGGDSDSTGIIAGACYGAMFGLEGVPPNNYTQLEYRDRLERLGSKLFDKSEKIATLEFDDQSADSVIRTDQDAPLIKDEVIIKDSPADILHEEPNTTGDEATLFDKSEKIFPLEFDEKPDQSADSVERTDQDAPLIKDEDIIKDSPADILDKEPNTTGDEATHTLGQVSTPDTLLSVADNQHIEANLSELKNEEIPIDKIDTT